MSSLSSRMLSAAALALVASTVAVGPAAAQQAPVISCKITQLELVLTAPANVTGTMKLESCTVQGRSDITQAALTISGTAGGSPSEFTDSETTIAEWQDASGTAVGTSTLTMLRAIVGNESGMVGNASGSVTGGLFPGALLSERTMKVTRVCATDTCTFTGVLVNNYLEGASPS